MWIWNPQLKNVRPIKTWGFVIPFDKVNAYSFAADCKSAEHQSDSEKNEEIGRLNRVINQKDVEIHNLTSELAIAKECIKELEGADDDTSSTPGKPEKNSSNSSIPPSQESIASRLKR